MSDKRSERLAELTSGARDLRRAAQKAEDLAQEIAASLAAGPCLHTRTEERADADAGGCVWGHTPMCAYCGKEMSR